MSETSPFYISGGFGYDSARNTVVGNHVRSLGHDVIPALPDPDVTTMPGQFHVSFNGLTSILHRRKAYFITDHPEVDAIISEYQAARADALIAHLSNHQQPVHGVFQSADAQNGLLAAVQRPDLFKSLTLAFPSGLIKKRGNTEYTRSMLRCNPTTATTKPEYEDDYEALSRPKTRREKRAAKRGARSGGFAVAASVVMANHVSQLHQLKLQPRAPTVSLVLGVHDPIMRPGRIIESLASPGDVDTILLLNCGHGWNGSKYLLEKTLQTATALPANTATITEKVMFDDSVPQDKRDQLVTVITSLSH